MIDYSDIGYLKRQGIRDLQQEIIIPVSAGLFLYSSNGMNTTVQNCAGEREEGVEMKKVVYNALYCNGKVVSAPNLKVCGGVDNYIKQSFVSLKSAKISNPDVEVCLITNQALPKVYTELFENNGIKIVIVPFDDYRVPKGWRWEYAFYKLKALDYMANEFDAEYLLGLDVDTYVPLSLNGFWDECAAEELILFSLPNDSLERGRRQMGSDYQMLMKTMKREFIVQYGGEFLGGSSKALQNLSKEISWIYTIIKENGFCVDNNYGDEALLSMAAHRIKVRSAFPYVRRYWSRRTWYDVDSAWVYVPVWHLPTEKNYGLNIIFERLSRNKKVSIKQAAKIFNLPIQRKYNFSMLKYYIYNILRRSVWWRSAVADGRYNLFMETVDCSQNETDEGNPERT